MTIKEAIAKIQNDLSLGHKGMAKLMNISQQVYRNKKSMDKFTQVNFSDLKNNLKKYCENL